MKANRRTSEVNGKSDCKGVNAEEIKKKDDIHEVKVEPKQGNPETVKDKGEKMKKKKKKKKKQQQQKVIKKEQTSQQTKRKLEEGGESGRPKKRGKKNTKAVNKTHTNGDQENGSSLKWSEAVCKVLENGPVEGMTLRTINQKMQANKCQIGKAKKDLIDIIRSRPPSYRKDQTLQYPVSSSKEFCTPDFIPL